MTCEVCSSGDLLGPFFLGNFPLCDDLTNVSANHSRNIEKFPQSIALCKNCFTAHQVFPVKKERLFQANYHYRASLTSDVLNGMRNLVNCVSEKVDLTQPKKVLDIGCNDGSLLSIFKKLYPLTTTIGVDPTNAIHDADNLDFSFNHFFSREIAEEIVKVIGKVDVITFTNVFAHIEDLPTLLENLKILIDERTILVIENHYLGSIFEKSQFDTFYHEHPRTYSATSFKFIAASLGMSIEAIDFPVRYGGNIRVFLSCGEKSNVDLSSIFLHEESFVNRFYDLESNYQQWKVSAKAEYLKLRKSKEVLGKSLPGRAVMLINALGLDDELMAKVFEKSASPKLGNYVPGTGIPIVEDADLSHFDGDIVVWAWHIVDEIHQQLRDLGFRGTVWVPLPSFMPYTPRNG